MTALTLDERDGLTVAVRSSVLRLAHLRQELAPVCARHGFAVPSAGVFARQLSEAIEGAIVQHCPTFERNPPHDLRRQGDTWEVKTSGARVGMTINQCYQVGGEHYLAVNYHPRTLRVGLIWVLYEATDDLFSVRSPTSNARHLIWAKAHAAGRVDILQGPPQQTRLWA